MAGNEVVSGLIGSHFIQSFREFFRLNSNFEPIIHCHFIALEFMTSYLQQKCVKESEISYNPMKSFQRAIWSWSTLNQSRTLNTKLLYTHLALSAFLISMTGQLECYLIVGFFKQEPISNFRLNGSLHNGGLISELNF